MKIPEDQTDPTLIEKAKSLFGVTFTDHAGTEHTAFDYLHGHVFYVRDKCPAPEYNGTVSCCKVESYLTFYEEYLNLIRVKKENNQDQFIIDNGIVAMFDKRIVSNTNCPSVNFHALYNTWPPNQMNQIFNAMFKGIKIEIWPDSTSYIYTGKCMEIRFTFNKASGEQYWTLEKDPTSECGYTSTSRDNEWTGIHCFNHRHMDAATMDSMILDAIDEIFDSIKQTYCTGTTVGVNKSGTKFIMPTGHVCRVVGGVKPTDPNTTYEVSIEFGEMFSATRYQQMGKTDSIPKVTNQITNDEFIKSLRTLFDSKAIPLYEFTKKNIGL